MDKEILPTAPEAPQKILPIVFDPNGIDRTFLTPEQRQLLEYIEQDPETFIAKKLAGYAIVGVHKPIEWFLTHYALAFNGLTFFRLQEDPPAQNGVDQIHHGH